MKRAIYQRIWKSYHNADIPDGYDIHHIDGNHSNNSPDNLVAIPEEEHHRLHWETKKKDKVFCYFCGKEYECYFGSRKGRKFCSNKCYQKFHYANKTYFETRQCALCGKDFDVKKADHTKCCSKSCSAKYWRKERKIVKV